MNRIHPLSRLATATLVAALAFAPVAAHAQLVLPRPSPKATVMQQIGITDLTVSYSRPGVKGRAIWGALVPYGQPWRTGANEATTFTTTDEIKVGGKALPAGTYSFFTIPAEGEWTVIFSKQQGQWGAYQYDPQQDAARVMAKPSTADHVEWMEFTFEDMTPNSANLTLRWEKMKLVVPIEVDVNGLSLAKARDEIGKAKSDDWRTPYRAAQFTFDNNVALDEGAKWLDQSLAIEQAYSNLNLKARWQAKNGDTKGAVETANKALAVNQKAKTPADASSLEALVAEWTGKKK
jgi:hypothetical protein